MDKQDDLTKQGTDSYQKWQEKLRTHPEYEQIYQEEVAKGKLWLQLVEARQRAGLSQAEVARRGKRPHPGQR